MLYLCAVHSIIFKTVKKAVISLSYLSFMHSFIYSHIFLKVQVLCNRL